MNNTRMRTIPDANNIGRTPVNTIVYEFKKLSSWFFFFLLSLPYSTMLLPQNINQALWCYSLSRPMTCYICCECFTFHLPFRHLLENKLWRFLNRDKRIQFEATLLFFFSIVSGSSYISICMLYYGADCFIKKFLPFFYLLTMFNKLSVSNRIHININTWFYVKMAHNASLRIGGSYIFYQSGFVREYGIGYWWY